MTWFRENASKKAAQTRAPNPLHKSQRCRFRNSNITSFRLMHAAYELPCEDSSIPTRAYHGMLFGVAIVAMAIRIMMTMSPSSYPLLKPNPEAQSCPTAKVRYHTPQKKELSRGGGSDRRRQPGASAPRLRSARPRRSCAWRPCRQRPIKTLGRRRRPGGS